MKTRTSACLVILSAILLLGACESWFSGKPDAEPDTTVNETPEQTRATPDHTEDADLSEVVVVADSALKEKINEALFHNPSQEITKADMLNLTYLSAEGCQIENLEGLQYATNLEDLNLYYNNISNLSPLSDLTGLKSLTLGANKISDIRSLSKLGSLGVLFLDNNLISDLGPLSELRQLRTLNVSRNSVNDISVLSKLWNLKELDVSYNRISDFSVLLDLPKLNIVRMREG